MITLLTGLPGNGKTLFILWYLKAKAEKEQREVYYSGITILDKTALPWTEFNAEDWPKLPKGAIILIDEAQFTFPKKPNGSKLPDYYEQLAVHRHGGYDIFVTTQHPSLLDNFVRQLVGQHFHCVRKFGLERSTIYEWAVANPSPQSATSQKSAITLKWAFPKEVYGWYKSAEVHTVKKRIPAKLVLAVVVVLLILGGVYYKMTHMVGAKPKIEGVTLAPGVAQGGAASVSSSPGAIGGKPFDPVADARQFVAMQTPRVAGLPQTSPKYDELTKPTHVPVPAACIQSGPAHPVQGAPRCKCFTQQGTPMDVPLGMCLEFARNGFFQDFDPDRDAANSSRAERSVAVLASRPDVQPGAANQTGPAVLAFAEVPPLPRVGGAPAVQGPNSDGLPNGGRGKALPPVGRP